MYSINVIVKTNFEALHSWETCNIPEVMFLKNLHRHIFYVTLKLAVSHTDRDLEFFTVKKMLDTYLTNDYNGKELKNVSCETICIEIFNWAEKNGMCPIYVSVFEDDECGAELQRNDK